MIVIALISLEGGINYSRDRLGQFGRKEVKIDRVNFL